MCLEPRTVDMESAGGALMIAGERRDIREVEFPAVVAGELVQSLARSLRERLRFVVAAEHRDQPRTAQRVTGRRRLVQKLVEPAHRFVRRMRAVDVARDELVGRYLL